MGHTDRECKKKLKKGEEAQYGRWMRYVPDGNPNLGERRRGGGQFGAGFTRRRYGGSSNGSKSGSDGPSWRREGLVSAGGKEKGRSETEGEVTSPLKLQQAPEDEKERESDGRAKKALFTRGDRREALPYQKDGVTKGGVPEEAGPVDTVPKGNGEKEGVELRDAGKEAEAGGAGVELNPTEKERVKGKGGKFKRIPREENNKGAQGVSLEKKRGADAMEVEEGGNPKKSRGDGVQDVRKAGQDNNDAGLSEQPCANQ